MNERPLRRTGIAAALCAALCVASPAAAAQTTTASRDAALVLPAAGAVLGYELSSDDDARTPFCAW